jgi:hypothetical protein
MQLEARREAAAWKEGMALSTLPQAKTSSHGMNTFSMIKIASFSWLELVERFFADLTRRCDPCPQLCFGLPAARDINTYLARATPIQSHTCGGRRVPTSSPK